MTPEQMDAAYQGTDITGGEMYRHRRRRPETLWERIGRMSEAELARCADRDDHPHGEGHEP